MGYKLGSVLYTEEQIREKVKEMGRKITEDYKDEPVLAVGILKGSFVFMSDLVRALDLDVTVDFMIVSSYGDATNTSGVVKIKRDLEDSIEGQNVLIIEDILDTGVTLWNLKKILGERNPKSLKIATMLDKPARRQSPIKADYTGFTIDDKFIVGYGLDYAQLYRNLPYIACMEETE